MSNPHFNTSIVRSNISFWFTFFKLIHEERQFLLLMAVIYFIGVAVYPYPGITMWIGFKLGGFSAITNDTQAILEEFFK